MPSKAIVLLLEAGLTLAVWWTVQSEDERRLMVAGFWQATERASMFIAKKSANLAAKAEQNYRQTVST